MSREAWGAIVAHEILHIIIGSSENAKPTDDNYVHHATMFLNYTNTLRDLLKDAFGISESDATKLALNGVEDIWEYPNFETLATSLYAVTKAQVLQTGKDYMSGGANLGTRCPN